MILVPAFMYLLNMEDKKAIGTSILCILVMVITSSFFYYKNNYIDWKVGILCAIGGMIGGFFGAKLLKKVSEKVELTVSYIGLGLLLLLTLFVTYKDIIRII